MIRYRRFAVSAAALATGAVAGGVFGFVAPASAHVTIDPVEVSQGDYARLAFRVPSESDTANTTVLEVTLPGNAPVAAVSTMPVPGWTVTIAKRKVDPPVRVHGTEVTEVVDRITWTATGDAAIRPGQFQEFPVAMGPLPAMDQMVFKAVQRYSDGSVVRWIEEPPAGGGEASESPAPVLRLVSAAAPAATLSAAARPDDGDDGNPGGTSGLALGLGVGGLLAGLAGLVLGGVAFARTRSRPGSGPVTN